MTSSVQASGRFDPARLNRIPAFLKDHYLDNGKLPCAQVLVADRGEVVHFSSQGPLREGAGSVIDETTLFRIASMTKPVTSVAFMMLLEEGKVALDTPVHRVFPEFKGVGVHAGGGGGAPFATRPLSEPMRMVDLLRHTSGLTYSFQYYSNVDAAYRAAEIENWHGKLDLDGFVAALARLPLQFSPGEAWNYSVSTDVLGAVVQRLSGQSLDEFFRSRIFAPLAMEDTFFTVPASKVHRLTDCYHMVPGKGREMLDRGAESKWSTTPKMFSGGGGLVSTALDYHRFCTMLLNGGTLEGARILSRKSIELMTANHLPGNGSLTTWSRSMFSETANAGIGFGLGFGVNLDPAATMAPGSKGEFYWGGMYSTGFFVDPLEQIHMVFMTQLGPSSTYAVRREVKSLIYAALN